MGSGWSNFISTGRTASNPSNRRTEPRDRRELPYPTPYHRFTTYENTDDDPHGNTPEEPPSNPPPVVEPITPPAAQPERPVQPPPPEVAKKPLKLKSVDNNCLNNARKHYTDDYDIVSGYEGTENGKFEPHLVVRRGQPFEITLTFDREYDSNIDDLHLLFEMGANPKVSKGTLVYLDLDGIKNKRKDQWGSEVINIDGKQLTIAIQASAECGISKWYFEVQTSIKAVSSDARRDINRFTQKEPVYMLFNPWCEQDQVFLPDPDLVDEHVLNETGLLYTGGTYQIGSRPWNYGQFESDILDCCMYLLDLSGLKDQSRGNPVYVSRAISKVVNVNDEGGVLVGNWSGDYDDGARPTAWTGSVKILEQYYETKKPVKFGQCWVFSGLVTTVARALGLPTRSVTNFSSAHDTDGSITIDKHWDIKGKEISRLNGDSVWNFHVWNECWMSRPDIPSPYNVPGWQAFDATPQEESEGVMMAGPACVGAIKDGHVNYNFDGRFIFAEVNADRVHWRQKENSDFKITRIVKHSVGQKLSTKRPRNMPRDEAWYNNRYRESIDEFREDLTLDYKYPEYSEDERVSVYRANLHSSRAGEVYDKVSGPHDVNFALRMKDGIVVGSVFNVTLEMQNTSRMERNVEVQLEIFSAYYTGIHVDDKPIKEQRFEIKIPPVKTKEAVMRVTMDDYIHKVTEQFTFEIDVYAGVIETDQEFPLVELYRLRRPDLIITAPSSAKVGEKIKVKVKLESPMPVQLTECEWDVEGAHVTKPISIPQADIDPYAHVEIEVEITPRKAGRREIMASFTSKQLQDITSVVPIEIEKE